MKKTNDDLSFLTIFDLTPPTTGGATQSSEQAGNPLDSLLPVPSEASVPVSASDPAAEPERPSRWASDTQVLEWKAKIQQLEDEQRSLDVSQIWSDVETDHSRLEEYQQQANALELAAESLQGTEKTTFVEARRSEWVALSESIRLAKAGRLAYEQRLALLEPVRTELAQLKAFLLADQRDTEEAAHRLTRYARQYGAG